MAPTTSRTHRRHSPVRSSPRRRQSGNINSTAIAGTSGSLGIGNNGGSSSVHASHVPSSSQSLSTQHPAIAPSPAGSSKENAPQPRTNVMPKTTSATPTAAGAGALKRKMSDRDASNAMEDGGEGGDEATKVVQQPRSKKAKTTTPAAKEGSTIALRTSPRKRQPRVVFQPEEKAKDSDDFYCHQCCKKRDHGVQCTYKPDDESPRCKNRYCKPCLKNRYGEDIDAIVARGEPASGPPKGHVKGSGYYFKCPQCEDTCNCRGCRRAKGLEPTGNLTLATRRSGINSVADLLLQNPDLEGIDVPGQGLPSMAKAREGATSSKGKKAKGEGQTKLKFKDVSQAKGKSGTKSKSNAEGDATKGIPQPKPKAKPKPKPKPLPQALWSPVPTTLNLSSAESRIYVREFALRFSSLLDLPKGAVEELEELGTEYNRLGDEPGVWVSESCVRSLFVGLLGLLADETSGQTKKIFRDAIKDLRTCGANLNRIWSALLTLRTSLSSTSSVDALTFSDPLPPPLNATVHNTRHAAFNQTENNGVFVAQSAQFVPVISTLVDEAVKRSGAMKRELDKVEVGLKELTKVAREMGKAENDRWEKEKNAKGAKPDRVAHKQRLVDIEQAYKVAAPSFALRSGPLGRDTDGRVYWLLPPGAGEREYASNVVQKGGKDVKVVKKAMLTGDERKGMKKWSWFVAVWGRKPRPVSAGDEKEVKEEVEGEEGWWGFWDPKEIKKLAGWVEGKFKVGTGKKGDEEEEEEEKGVELPKHRHVSAASGTTLSAPGSDWSSRASSPLSDIDDEEDEDEEADEDDMGGADLLNQPPSKKSMRALVKGLRDYAEVLEWRISKWEKTVEVNGEAGKDKAKEGSAPTRKAQT